MLYATYNIEAGGFKGYHDLESREPVRLTELQVAIAEINADVIALPDSFRWHELYQPADIQKMFGYDNSISVPLQDSSMTGNGDKIGISLLSKRPFMTAGGVSLGGLRNAIYARIEDDALNPINVFARYAHHAKEQRRVQEAQWLVSHARGLHADRRLKRTIDMGDLNTSADSTFATQVIGPLARRLGGGSGSIAEFGEDCKGDAIRVLLDAGFVDTSKDRRATFPTPHFTKELVGKLTKGKIRTVGGIAVPPLLRLDYIMATEDLQVVSSAVRHAGGVFARASDHYPLAAELV